MDSSMNRSSRPNSRRKTRNLRLPDAGSPDGGKQQVGCDGNVASDRTPGKLARVGAIPGAGGLFLEGNGGQSAESSRQEAVGSRLEEQAKTEKRKAKNEKRVSNFDFRVSDSANPKSTIKNQKRRKSL